MFFKSKPNLPDSDRVRIEFHLQQISECIGADRFQLPILGKSTLLGLPESGQSPEQIVHFAGKHLSHDVNELRVQVVPQVLEKAGGGG